MISPSPRTIFRLISHRSRSSDHVYQRHLSFDVWCRWDSGPAGQGKAAARDARDASHAKGGERRSFAPRDSVEESVSHCQPKLNRKGQELLMARNPEGRLNILKPFKSETTAQYCIDSPTLIEP